MIVSAIDWLSISINLLLAVFLIVCLLMSLIILMQRPKNEGLGAAFGSGATDQLFGARTTNVLQKATVYLATLFFVITLTLSILIQKRSSGGPTLVADAKAEEAPVVAEEQQPASIAEEAEQAGEKPLEPEAATPPAETPAEPEGMPAPAEQTPDEPKPEAAPAEGGEGAATPEAAPAPAEGEPEPAEQTPPAGEEQPAENP